VQEGLASAGMQAYAKRSSNKLSGGQKQRVAIAGVVAMCPKCIVLDEPTAMLDPQGRHEVLETMRRLNKEQGVTIILITHNMEEVVEADCIYVMNHGKITMQGTPREVFARVEELESCRLEVPQMTRLSYELKKEGLPLPEVVLNREELVQALERLR
jgi:energy-coupling factor transport system ATP-binding protein